MAWRAQSLPRQLDWSGPGSATRLLQRRVPVGGQARFEGCRVERAEDIAGDAFRAVDHEGQIGLEHLVGQGVDVSDQRGIVFPPARVLAGVACPQADIAERWMIA